MLCAFHGHFAHKKAKKNNYRRFNYHTRLGDWNDAILYCILLYYLSCCYFLFSYLGDISLTIYNRYAYVDTYIGQEFVQFANNKIQEIL